MTLVSTPSVERMTEGSNLVGQGRTLAVAIPHKARHRHGGVGLAAWWCRWLGAVEWCSVGSVMCGRKELGASIGPMWWAQGFHTRAPGYAKLANTLGISERGGHADGVAWLGVGTER